jgi:hypothetical protein
VEREVIDLDAESTHLERWTILYVERLSNYIDRVTHVEPPLYAPDGADKVVRRRHELNRLLQAVLREVMG